MRNPEVARGAADFHAPDDDGWWCWECHGLGGWYESQEETDEPGDVDCFCCGGDGTHYGDEPPRCAPAPKETT